MLIKPTVKVVCDAVHITSTSRSGIYNIRRLRRAVELMRSGEVAGSIAQKLRAEFPTMASADAVNHVLAAQQIIGHNIDLDRLDS